MEREIRKRFSGISAVVVGMLAFVVVIVIFLSVLPNENVLRKTVNDDVVVMLYNLGVIFLTIMFSIVAGFFGGWAFPEQFIECPEKEEKKRK
jgi:hypothetical protein